MQDSTYILEMNNISKAFPGSKALDDVTMRVHKGEVLALVGENGAGKSTLIKILAGAYTKDSGEIILEGKPVSINTPIEGNNLGIAVIYQELSLFQDMTAIENMFVGKWLRNKSGFVDWKGMREHVEKVFEEYSLHVPIDVPVKELSVAECQMIEIIRAVSFGAKIIVMDEPTSSLSDKEVSILFEMIKELKNKGVTIIYISHRLEELFVVCDRILVLKDGRNSGEFLTKEVTKDNIITAMIGRKLENYYPSRQDYVQNDEVLLKVENMSFGAKVKDVSFDVHKGEILGFAGLVGAGRTELMRSIFKAEQKTSGKVYVEGDLKKIKCPKDAIKAGIAFATEDRKNEGLILMSSITHNITIANLSSISNKAGILNLRKENKLVSDLKEKLNIKAPTINKIVYELSGGNQQKVVVAKWLNTNAKVYIFDEPTRGVDVGAKAEIYQLLDAVARDGNAVIVVSSELPEVLGVCDRILVINEGRITGEFDRASATEEKIMNAAVGGD